MSLIALFAWIATAGIGLYLLSIWLIEYDKEFQAEAATRLPPPVLLTHVVLAGGGLIIWADYLVYDNDYLAWIAVAAILTAATLGLVMGIRWIGVYRATRSGALLMPVPQHSGVAVLDRPLRPGPPERNFPLPAVIAHGVFAALTITLILLSVFGSGSS
jgi:hypothetical protein